MPSAALSHHRIVLVLLTILAFSGCETGPDLRGASQAMSKPSSGEGRRLLEEGQAAQAVTVFRRRIREEGPDLRALNGLAIAYSELGKPDLAAEMFSRALAIKPDDPATLNNIGFSALRRADGRLARHYLEKAMRGNAGFEKIEGNLARLALLEDMDLKRLARPAFNPAARLSEQRTPARMTSISFPQGGERHHPAMQVSGDRPPKLAERSMIDFTAVIDPFSQDRPVAGHQQ